MLPHFFGPYDQLGRSYEKLLAHEKDHDYDVVLPTREVYIKGPGMIFKGNPKKCGNTAFSKSAQRQSKQACPVDTLASA